MMPKHSWSAALGLKHAYALIQLHSCFELAQTIRCVVQEKPDQTGFFISSEGTLVDRAVHVAV